MPRRWTIWTRRCRGWRACTCFTGCPAEATQIDRRPLAEGQGLWPTYLRQAAAGPRGTGLFALLEFVQDDDPANLSQDAEVLRQWTSAVNAAAAR